MAYDTIVDNLYVLSLPPQLNQTVDVGTNFPGTPLVTPAFLANGGISPNVLPGATTDPAAARAATSAWIADQQVPYSLSWSLTYQRELHKNYALEIRYLTPVVPVMELIATLFISRLWTDWSDLSRRGQRLTALSGRVLTKPFVEH